MSYTPNLNDKNSEYYYGLDSTYKPRPRKPQPQKPPAVRRPLLTDDPELQGYGDLSVPSVPNQSASVRPSKGRMAKLGPKYKEQELEAGRQAEEFRPGAGFPGQSVEPTYTPPGSGTGREEPAPDGGSARGTQTSPRQMTMDDANALLTGGYKVANPFSSTQLPDTSGSPYFGQGKSVEYRSDVPADTYNPKLSRDLTDGNPFVTGDIQYQIPTNTNIEYLQTEGSPKIPLSGAVKASEQTEAVRNPQKSRIPKRPRGGRQAEVWDRQYGRMNQEPEANETKGSGIDYKRRAAFLDAPGSMQGLRRVEAQKGMVYASGQHNIVNPNAGQDGEPAFKKLDKEDRDAYMGGRMTADEIKQKFVKKVSESKVDQGISYQAPPNYKMDPEIDVKTAQSQRPAIEIDTSSLSTPVEYEAPAVMFNKGRDKYKK